MADQADQAERTGPHSPGPLALVGSGEFLPSMLEVDAALLDGRPPVVAVIPTAAGPEGDQSVHRWFRLAEGHYSNLGATTIRVDVRDRDGALDPAMADLVRDVGMIYLSGGNPGHLASSLHGTPLAAAIERRWRSGAALAGCSAGAMALGRTTLTLRGSPVTGLGLAGPIATIPHYDRMAFARRIAGALLNRLTDDGDTILGVDEHTAVVWRPSDGCWRVAGTSRAHLVTTTGGRGEGFGHGEQVPLPAPA